MVDTVKQVNVINFEEDDFNNVEILIIYEVNKKMEQNTKIVEDNELNSIEITKEDKKEDYEKRDIVLNLMICIEVILAVKMARN